MRAIFKKTAGDFPQIKDCRQPKTQGGGTNDGGYVWVG
jgi:hypothetical protein